MLLHQPCDLSDPLGDGAGRLESQLIRYPRKRNPVVPRVLSFVHKLDDGIWRIGTDQLNQLLFLEILICCTDIKHTATYIRLRRAKNQVNCAGGITHMYVRAPELLAKNLEVLLGHHLHTRPSAAGRLSHLEPCSRLDYR